MCVCRGQGNISNRIHVQHFRRITSLLVMFYQILLGPSLKVQKADRLSLLMFSTITHFTACCCVIKMYKYISFHPLYFYNPHNRKDESTRMHLMPHTVSLSVDKWSLNPNTASLPLTHLLMGASVPNYSVLVSLWMCPPSVTTTVGWKLATGFWSLLLLRFICFISPTFCQM